MNDDIAPAPGMISTNRVEAFSDGVFAIAITLLVLDLTVPTGRRVADGGLARALANQWPAYFAYVVSFLVIGIIWVNHHAVFATIRRVDRLTLFVNLALLMTVSVIPFPTRLMAVYLLSGADSHVAAALYSATMLAMSLTFSALWICLTRDGSFLHEHLDARAGRAAIRRFGLGNVFYLATVGLSFASAIATLVVHAALAIYYCFDQLSSDRLTRDTDP